MESTLLLQAAILSYTTVRLISLMLCTFSLSILFNQSIGGVPKGREAEGGTFVVLSTAGTDVTIGLKKKLSLAETKEIGRGTTGPSFLAVSLKI